MSTHRVPKHTARILPDKNIVLADWADEHDLIEALVPYSYLRHDPIEVLEAMREVINDKPPTAATLTNQQVYDKFDVNVKNPLGHRMPVYWRILGSWPVELNKGHTNNWPNPNYAHAKSFASITDTKQRLNHAIQAAETGAVTRRDLADSWGLTGDSVERTMEKYGLDWSTHKTRGAKRLAKTAHVINKWTGMKYSRIAKAVGIKRGTMTSRVSRHVDVTKWPDDPTAEGTQ